ncbi:S41 family peptidase [Pseudoalteromonas sp. OOF1S-7]|uniref:S41 family peptidase n=1 Tax=Pseudoalteromonas sp. OOF1S-7 TaxID=2917757 RepID=UPI001EF4CB0E|nr:S41 family peptidase [Pseudoalteromonas sp. OOF1S-7]MCG7535604.1 S41 family peptidase [Pseudoalteromonas sp. OOF1S-7]
MIIIKNLTVASLLTSTLCFASNTFAQNTSPPADATTLLPSPAVNLDRALLKDIKQFVKFANKVKFFYPSQAVAATNWDKFVAETIVELSQTEPYRRQEVGLQRLREIAPFIVERRRELPDLRGNEPAVAWQQDAARTIYYYTRQLSTGNHETMKANVQLPDRNFARVKYGWRTLYMPLYLPQSASDQGLNYSDYRQWQVGTDFSSSVVCMSTVSAMWGEIHHYWPYFEQVDVNWQRSLMPLLKACTEEVPTTRIKAINSEFKKLQDEHVRIFYPWGYEPQPSYNHPFILRRVEGKSIVVGLLDVASPEIEIGDELLMLNEVPFEDLVEERASWLTNNDHTSKNHATKYLNFSAAQAPVNAIFRKPDGRVIEVNSNKVHVSEGTLVQWRPLVPRDSVAVKELESGLWQLNLYNLTQQNIQQAKAQLQDARAVVLDLRQYPKDFFAWQEGLSWFIDQPIEHGELYRYHRKGPARRAFYSQQIRQTIEVSENPLDIPVIVLASRESISLNEHALIFAKKAGMPILGVATSGINGEVMSASYFDSGQGSGIGFWYTAMRADNADGSILIGRGVQPDIYVPRTIESIIANEDNQLSAAIEYLKDQL